MKKLARKEQVDEKNLTTLKRLKVERRFSGNCANTRENSQNNSTHNTVVVEDDHQTEEVFCDSTLGSMFLVYVWFL